MSFWKKLFGGSRENAAVAPAAEAEHKGFRIVATPYAEGGQYQTCGVVSKEVAGSLREHRFVRADRFASAEDAAAHALRKGVQLVDEQGERMFDASH